MATSKLQLYNDALLICGERSISALTNETEGRRLLDIVWDNNGVDGCLEEAQWEFAMRTQQVDYDPSVEPPFGYNRAFTKPTDWIITSAVCSDEFFHVPILRYVDEAGFWYSDLDTIYVRYVSNDSSYGGDLGKWPRSFTEFVATHFASKIILKLSNDEARTRLLINTDNPEHSLRFRALLHAKSRCAMAGPTTYPAQGQWTRSRTRGTARRDGGNISGNLIG